MQPTNFPALVNNFSNEKQNKNRKKIQKKGQGSFRSRIPPVGYFSFFPPKRRSQSRKHTTGVQQPGPTQLRERRFSTSFFFFSHVIIGPPIPSEKQIGRN
jgi:hypothetical protein